LEKGDLHLCTKLINVSFYTAIHYLFSLTSKLVVSDELSLIIENNENVKDLNTEQIDKLLSLTNSWMESIQKEINFIEDIMVGNPTMFCLYFFLNKVESKYMRYF